MARNGKFCPGARLSFEGAPPQPMRGDATPKGGTQVIDRLSNPKEPSRHSSSQAPACPITPSIEQIGSMFAGGISLAILLLAASTGAEGSNPEPTPIAVIDFDYFDTSGEVQNQTAKHEALLRKFMSAVRHDLGGSERYRIVSVTCQPEPCSIAHSSSSEILAKASRAGATLLLYGGIHKKSTLVQWARVQVVDVRTDKLVFDRLLTFRGDDDRAWQRAEAFLVRDLETYDFSK